MREPHDGETLQHGTIYLALADHHMVFHEGYVSVLHGPKESYARPSIDRLFRSAAIAYGERVVGVLLSGAGTDE